MDTLGRTTRRKTPLVSILMATRNCPQYLGEALRSIQRQTLKDIEIIIVDESDDGMTRRLLHAAGRKDRRIRIIERKGLGLAKSLNVALKSAKGTYVARMDADDIALPKRLAKQAAFLNSHREVGIVGTWATIIDSAGKRQAIYKTPVTHQECAATIIKTPPFIHPSIMARRDVLLPYDERFRHAEDYELWTRMICRTRFANIPEKLMEYRQDFKNLSFTSGKKGERYALLVRWRLLRSGAIPWWHGAYLARPLIMYLVPVSWKIAMLNFLRRRNPA